MMTGGTGKSRRSRRSATGEFNDAGVLRTARRDGFDRSGRGRRGIDYDLSAIDLAQRTQGCGLRYRDRLAVGQWVDPPVGSSAALPG